MTFNGMLIIPKCPKLKLHNHEGGDEAPIELIESSELMGMGREPTIH
jgi:hypothetical protein